MATSQQLNLLELPNLNVDVAISSAMARIVEASGLSRIEVLEKLNDAAHRHEVRLCSGNAKVLGLATFEKWLNANAPEHLPSIRALNLFCHVFESHAPLDILAQSHGWGWQVIDNEDGILLDLARTEREIKNLRAKKRKLEAGL